jgi:hypothetical protein
MAKSGRRSKDAKEGEVVKTSVHLPEDLWHKAKMRAIEERTDLRSLIIEGLELVLSKRRG